MSSENLFLVTELRAWAAAHHDHVEHPMSYSAGCPACQVLDLIKKVRA